MTKKNLIKSSKNKRHSAALRAFIQRVTRQAYIRLGRCSPSILKTCLIGLDSRMRSASGVGTDGQINGCLDTHGLPVISSSMAYRIILHKRRFSSTCRISIMMVIENKQTNKQTKQTNKQLNHHCSQFRLYSWNKIKFGSNWCCQIYHLRHRFLRP